MHALFVCHIGFSADILELTGSVRLLQTFQLLCQTYLCAFSPARLRGGVSCHPCEARVGINHHKTASAASPVAAFGTERRPEECWATVLSRQALEWLTGVFDLWFLQLVQSNFVLFCTYAADLRDHFQNIVLTILVSLEDSLTWHVKKTSSCPHSRTDLESLRCS